MLSSRTRLFVQRSIIHTSRVKGENLQVLADEREVLEKRFSDAAGKLATYASKLHIEVEEGDNGDRKSSSDPPVLGVVHNELE
eukprot:1131272-Amorphochlora_amoeboformis.AAC.1